MLTRFLDPGSTYPLDLVRSRLSIATASVNLSVQPKAAPALGATPLVAKSVSLASAAYHTSSAFSKADLTIVGMTMKIMREEGGIRALYRGLVTTAVGVAPYVGLNFASYEALRGIITPPGKSSIPRKLACGALAGACLLLTRDMLTFGRDVIGRLNISDTDLPV